MATESRTLAAASAGAAFALMFASADAGQHESRQLDSHEHGVTEMNVALDDDLLYVELEAPAMNFVGFEHPPRTAEQNKAIAETLTALKNPPAIFSVAAAANCTTLEANAKHLLDADDETGHSDHEEHDDHEEHNDSADHSEFVANYRLRCTRPEELRSIRIELFDAFPLTTEVETSFIGLETQSFGELTSSNPELSFEP